MAIAGLEHYITDRQEIACKTHGAVRVEVLNVQRIEPDFDFRPHGFVLDDEEKALYCEKAYSFMEEVKAKLPNVEFIPSRRRSRYIDVGGQRMKVLYYSSFYVIGKMDYYGRTELGYENFAGPRTPANKGWKYYVRNHEFTQNSRRIKNIKRAQITRNLVKQVVRLQKPDTPAYWFAHSNYSFLYMLNEATRRTKIEDAVKSGDVSILSSFFNVPSVTTSEWSQILTSEPMIALTTQMEEGSLKMPGLTEQVFNVFSKAKRHFEERAAEFKESRDLKACYFLYKTGRQDAEGNDLFLYYFIPDCRAYLKSDSLAVNFFTMTEPRIGTIMDLPGAVIARMMLLSNKLQSPFSTQQDSGLGYVHEGHFYYIHCTNSDGPDGASEDDGESE